MTTVDPGRPDVAPGWSWRELAVVLVGYGVLGFVLVGVGRLLGLDSMARRLPLVLVHQALAVLLVWTVLGPRRDTSGADLGFRLPPSGGRSLASLALGGAGQMLLFSMAGAVLTAVVYHLLGRPLPKPPNILAELHGPAAIALFAVVAVVGAPVSEELVFRGVLHRFLRARWRPVIAILVSSSVFSIGHLEPAFFFLRLGMGIALANTFEASRSLVPGILVHAGQNLLVFCVQLAR